MIRQSDFLAIRHIEEISDESELITLIDRPGIVRMHIELRIRIGTSKLTAATRRDFARVQIGRVSQELADRDPSLNMEAKTNVQSVQRLSEPVLGKRIASEDVDDVPAICIERTNRKLIAKQVEVARSKVKQRTDSRISLTVVIPEVTFKVSSEGCNSPV